MNPVDLIRELAEELKLVADRNVDFGDTVEPSVDTVLVKAATFLTSQRTIVLPMCRVAQDRKDRKWLQCGPHAVLRGDQLIEEQIALSGLDRGTLCDVRVIVTPKGTV